MKSRPYRALTLSITGTGSTHMTNAAPSFDYKNPDPLLATLVRMFATEGAAREVAVLAHSAVQCYQTDCDGYGDESVCLFTLQLTAPADLFVQIEAAKDAIEQNIFNKARDILVQ